MPHTGVVRVRSRLAVALSAAVMVATAAPASATAGAAARSDGTVVGLTVPWAVGGPRIEADGSLRNFPGEWPTIPFASIRLWDTRTAWLNLEPRDGSWDFRRLDQFVAKAIAHGVTDISLVLGGTPRWAAAQVRPTDAAWMGPGSASPPRRMSDWADFVSTVAERYRGRITSYEIWNEPNNVTFWSGTRAQWAQLVQVAAERVKAADPSATVVASGLKLASPADTPAVATWIASLGAVHPRVDSISVHWYPDRAADLSLLTGVLGSVGTASRAAGVVGGVWVTEVNVRRGATWSAPAQRAAVATLTEAARAGGAERLTWYAWTDLGPPGLMQLYPRTPAAVAIAASQHRIQAESQ